MDHHYYWNDNWHGHDFSACIVICVLFLRNVQGSFAENQKLQLLRSTYQKAVATPLLGVESVWKEYNQFENVRIITITDSSLLFNIFSLWKHIGNTLMCMYMYTKQ